MSCPWFTMVPLKALSGKVWIRYPCFVYFNCLFSFANSLFSVLCISCLQEIINTFNYRTKQRYLQYYWSDKDFNGTNVNRILSSLNNGSLETFKTVLTIWIACRKLGKYYQQMTGVFHTVHILYNSLHEDRDCYFKHYHCV